MRKTINRIAIALLTISLAGCASFAGPLGDVSRVLTATIANPVGETDIYRVKNTYAAAGELVVEWRNYCWSAPYATLMKDPVARTVCSNRRGRLRIIQSADSKAFAAIAAAEKFVAENPTLSAASAVSAAWQAVTAFQNAIPAKKG